MKSHQACFLASITISRGFKRLEFDSKISWTRNVPKCSLPTGQSFQWSTKIVSRIVENGITCNGKAMKLAFKKGNDWPYHAWILFDPIVPFWGYCKLESVPIKRRTMAQIIGRTTDQKNINTTDIATPESSAAERTSNNSVWKSRNNL